MNDIKVPKRIENSIINALQGGVVPRVGLGYIAVGREQEIKAYHREDRAERKSEERKCFNLSGSNGIGILETGGTVPKRTADFGRSFADGGSRRVVGYGAVGCCAAKLMLAKTN